MTERDVPPMRISKAHEMNLIQTRDKFMRTTHASPIHEHKMNEYGHM